VNGSKGIYVGGRRMDARPYLDLACAIRYGQARAGDLRRTLGADQPQPGSEPPRGGLGSAQVLCAAGPLLTLLTKQCRNPTYPTLRVRRDVVEEFDREEGEGFSERVEHESPHLSYNGPRPGIHSGALQHGLLEPFGMAHRQVGYDLVPEGVADERRALQPDFPHPGGESPSHPGRDGASLPSPNPGSWGAQTRW
jgi:hypothetical protein